MTINFFNLNSKYRLDAYKPASKCDDINEFKKHFYGFTIPDDYVSFISQLTEAEILVLGDSYIRIWGAIGCIEMNSEYNIQRYIKNSMAIGDDEGGKVIFYANGKNGFGLYKVGFGNLDIEDAEYIAPSLTEFLINGDGAENFL
ncbi:SMI1 / KNR4 family protein [Photorhabdus australis subsp. thailandensis]|uniref:SMI1 / KNR4 family protein n=1 Tax=Photorhabdus australis subsp. thailandensis TaxID=2805096 RepID=A0A1C0U1G2_9GAMM|nr:SMI1/KNR4 family protein [Photorhabdus australis]OCQ51759.1 SMI1 / KNR4 family protein [Photorhabdus australis subsp. thailandensis]